MADIGSILERAEWYDLPPDEAGVNERKAQALLDTVQEIERRQQSIHEGNKRHARIYAGYLPTALAIGASPTSNYRAPFEATKALVRAVCDTATSMIVRSRPKASVVTDGADWKVQQQAEQADQFLVGAYESGNLYKVAPRSFHDSTVFGTGGWKYVPRGRASDFKLTYERIFPDDLVVDEDETREDLIPVNLYFRTVVRVDALVKKYARGDSTREQLIRARLRASENTQTWPTLHVPRGHTVIVEGYHVDQWGGGPNRRTVAVAGVVLEDDVWPFDFHPATFLWWNLPISGFYGDGIAYRQYGRQQRITYMHKWIQRVLDLFATPTAWIDPVGGPPTLQMSTEIGKVISARRPPVFQTQQIVPPEVYRWLDKLEMDGFEDEGINHMSSAGMLQPGVESAPAMREQTYKEGQRFAPVTQRWEHAIAVETAKKTLAFYRHQAANGATPRVRWADRKLVHEIDWPDLETDAYEIRAEASSLDALSYSARVQAALEMAQTGWIGPVEGRALLAHPDLKESDDLGTAGFTHAQWVARKLWNGEAVMVDEKSDMLTVMDVAKKTRLLAIQKNAPDKIIANFDRFIEELDNEIKLAQEAAAQAAMAQMAQAAPAPGLSEASSEGRPSPFAGGDGYT